MSAYRKKPIVVEAVQWHPDRVEPFADRCGIQTRPLTHLLQEAYLQGMSDAVEAMEAR